MAKAKNPGRPGGTAVGLLPAGAKKGTSALRHLFGPVIVIGTITTLVALIAWTYYGGPPQRVTRGMPAIPAYRGATPLQPGASPLKEVLDSDVEDYKDNLSKLYANIGLQALLVGIAILLLIRRSDDLSFFSNSIPLSWLHFLLPVLMIYVWLGFGFLLHNLIEGRVRGVNLIEELAKSDPSYKQVMEFEKARFHDGGFIDGWFIAFVDDNQDGNYSGIRPSFSGSTAVLLIVVLGTLLSACHAGMIAISSIGCRRYLDERQQLLWYYAAPLPVLCFLLASHLQFAYGGDNPNWIHLYIALVTPALTMLFLWLSAVIDSSPSYPGNVQSLRRHHRSSLFPMFAMERLKADAATPESGTRTISLIGDSLSTRFHVSWPPIMVFRMWRAWKINWFLKLEEKQGARSILQRLSDLGPITGIHHASVSATVDGCRRSFIDRVTDTWNFPQQVDEVLAGEFPDLLVLWIGHNDVDWKARVDSFTDESRNQLCETFAHYYEVQLRRLLNAALARKKETVVIVFGLVNFEAFFGARAQAEEAKKSSHHSFPHLETGYKYFASMMPENRSNMIALARGYNQKLEQLCKALNRELGATKVRLVYSDALSVAPIGTLPVISRVDAWHPSEQGQAILADSAYPVIETQAIWLGWKQADVLAQGAD